MLESAPQRVKPITKIKDFMYLNTQYYVAISHKSFALYSTQHLDLVQEFLNFDERIKNVYFLDRKKCLLVLCERSFHFYSFTFTNAGSLWLAKQVKVHEAIGQLKRERG